MKKLVVANWKMNPQTLEEARVFGAQIEHGLLGVDRSRAEVAICPPFVFLPVMKHAIHFAKLGAQNMSFEASGPYTGEISVHQLREFGVNFVIIGHSERRNLGETDKLVAAKIKLALAHGLYPILCVGYGTTKKMTESTVKKNVKKQIDAAFKGLSRRDIRAAVAYEPVWAISRGFGTGTAVEPEHAAEIIGYIKNQVPTAKVLYGGSLQATNARGFAAQKVIDGGLVGGASLKPAEFLGIVRSFTD